MSRTVLVVAPYLPWPADFGGALRIYHLVRQLAATQQVIVLAPATQDEFESIRELGTICDVATVPTDRTARQPPGPRKRLTQLGSLVGGRSYLERSSYLPQMQSAIARLFLTREIDLVQFEFPASALYRLPEPRPTVFDAHNIEHELLRRVAGSSTSALRTTFNLAEYRKVRRLERTVWNRAALCIATSDRDAGLIERATSRAVPVVPNGVDLEAFAPLHDVPVRPHHIVFTGAMRHQPNAVGAVWLARQVMPLVRREIPDATLTIAGADPPDSVRELASDCVTVTGRVPDIRDFLAEAAVVAVPLFSGGGTRLKVLEALAMAKPVVSTSLGAEGLDLAEGEHVSIADSPTAFASTVVELMRDRERAAALGLNGRAIVEQRYGWRTIGQHLNGAHELAIKRFHRSTQVD